MSIDVGVVTTRFGLIVAAAVAITLLKAGIVAVLFRATCPNRGDGVRAGSVLTSAGEFSFVLIPFGVLLGAIGAQEGNLFTAIAAVTMMIGPPFAALSDRALARLLRVRLPEPDGLEEVRGSALVIGFGRFGQIVSQCLLAESVDVITLDNDPEMIRSAGRFGFKVYYGDGLRLDVLRAAISGADVRLIAVCIDPNLGNHRAQGPPLKFDHSLFDGTRARGNRNAHRCNHSKRVHSAGNCPLHGFQSWRGFAAKRRMGRPLTPLKRSR
jgi:hypothetical protein